MPISLVFWVLMLFWIVSRLFTWGGVSGPYGTYILAGSDLMILVLIFLLGWHDFGFIIHS